MESVHIKSWGRAENNFGALRLILASIVVAVHVQNLSQIPELSWIPEILSSGLAVQGFFAISGYLIISSFEASQGLSSYAGKRFRRLYPAYFVSLVVTSIALWPASSVSAYEYYLHDLPRYLGWNLVFANFKSPGIADVFVGNPKNSAINGALWTLKLEVAFYCLVPLIVWLRHRVGTVAILTSIYIFSVGYSLFTPVLGYHQDITKQLPGQLTYFIAGAGLFYLRTHLRATPNTLLIAGTITLILSHFIGGVALRPVAIGMIIISVAFLPYTLQVEQFGDLSYGLYIVHYPIIQALIVSRAFATHPFLLIVATYVLAFLAALLMWHLVEKRFLKRRNHYLREAKEPK